MLRSVALATTLAYVQAYKAEEKEAEEPTVESDAPRPYRVPTYEVAYEDNRPDLTPIIVGFLIVIGLFLLFPTFVSIRSVRRKREEGTLVFLGQDLGHDPMS